MAQLGGLFETKRLFREALAKKSLPKGVWSKSKKGFEVKGNSIFEPSLILEQLERLLQSEFGSSVFNMTELRKVMEKPNMVSPSSLFRIYSILKWLTSTKIYSLTFDIFKHFECAYVFGVFGALRFELFCL